MLSVGALLATVLACLCMNCSQAAPLAEDGDAFCLIQHFGNIARTSPCVDPWCAGWQAATAPARLGMGMATVPLIATAIKAQNEHLQENKRKLFKENQQLQQEIQKLQQLKQQLQQQKLDLLLEKRETATLPHAKEEMEHMNVERWKSNAFQSLQALTRIFMQMFEQNQKLHKMKKDMESAFQVKEVGQEANEFINKAGHNNETKDWMKEKQQLQQGISKSSTVNLQAKIQEAKVGLQEHVDKWKKNVTELKQEKQLLKDNIMKLFSENELLRLENKPNPINFNKAIKGNDDFTLMELEDAIVQLYAKNKQLEGEKREVETAYQSRAQEWRNDMIRWRQELDARILDFSNEKAPVHHNQTDAKEMQKAATTSQAKVDMEKLASQWANEKQQMHQAITTLSTKNKELEKRLDAEGQGKEAADSKTKQEAEKKGKESTDSKAKHETEKKGKEAADSKAKQEAQKKGKEPADSKAKQEVGKKGKKAPESKAKRETQKKASAMFSAKNEELEEMRLDADEQYLTKVFEEDSEEMEKQDLEDAITRVAIEVGVEAVANLTNDTHWVHNASRSNYGTLEEFLARNKNSAFKEFLEWKKGKHAQVKSKKRRHRKRRGKA